MTCYIYIIIKYIITVLLLVLIIKYTPLIELNNTSIIIILTILLVSVFIDIIFCNMFGQNNNDIEYFVEQKNNNGEHSIGQKIVPFARESDKSMAPNGISSESYINPKKEVIIYEPSNIKMKHPIISKEKYTHADSDDKLFDNYKLNYYEMDIEKNKGDSLQSANSPTTTHMDSKYNEMYKLYMQNSYKASLE